ncbi:hypothetical protein GCM10020358_57130 [Amorphoplanes nipponensis]|uniref:Uncharacterized protein n=1 Tax=Actinoplanes nipponensis TaxID=135950 RepID=A0A919MMT2_9ACTN|nr:hypothetical protein [Actinoplanes nipponensis]GIE47748.1 hypothetical protein Ani05nite_12820 [Actinoplanes nipponensis]
MWHLDARRLTGVLAVAGVLLVTGVGPARADGIHRGDPVSVAFPDIEVPVGGAAVDPLGPSLWSTGPTKLTGASVTYDLSGVAGVRLTPVDGGGECVRPSPARVVCSDPRTLSFEGETIEQYLPVEVRAARTARTGDTGTVTITFSADGLAPITGRSRVRVVEGRTDLAATGPVAGLIGGLGGLVLGAGVAGVLATRRRRTRFLA